MHMLASDGVGVYYGNANQGEVCMTCPCGTAVKSGGRGLGKVFCSTKCRQQYNNRLKIIGAPMAILIMAWEETRHAKPGTQDAEICRFARSQMTMIAHEANEGLRENGQPPASEMVTRMIKAGSIWADRKRGPRDKRPAEDTGEQLEIFDDTARA
jgi:hypothetical protein